MTVKQFWKKDLGDFRDEDRVLIKSLCDKRVAVDTSAWVHQLDTREDDVQYARTSEPRYPHPAVINLFARRYAALLALGIRPVFVLDGKSPPMKVETNTERQKKSTLARIEYHKKIKEIKQAEIRSITDEERRELLKNRRAMARPTPEEYASVSEWCEVNNIEYVQAPFEADAQIKRIIDEGRATAAITEDGDLIVFGVPHILSQTKIDTLESGNSTCQYFDIEKLVDGSYDSLLEKGQRSKFLAEISCLSGNDYINNVPNVGPAAIFGTHKSRTNQTALIDSFIDDTVTNNTKTERQWLDDYITKYGTEDGDNNGWSIDRFIKARNLIKHYPIFAKNDETGDITLQPLNPLPSNIPHDEWGSYIGFDKHPSEYFPSGTTYKEYYNMVIVGSTDKLRDEHLGPKYTANENPHVEAGTRLPLFGRLDLDKVPICAQPPSVLKRYLLSRGVVIPGNVSGEKLREMVHSLEDASSKRRVLDPSLIPEAESWVGFEPLENDDLGDEYDDWVSPSTACCIHHHLIFLTFLRSSLLLCRIMITLAR